VKAGASRWSAFWLLVALIVAFTVHNLFRDKTLAFYVAQATLGVYLMIRDGWRADKRIAFVCLYGLFLFGTTAACGVVYPQLQDGQKYLCDTGTGAPVSVITWLVGVLLLVWVMRTRDG
jgi:hypothetical protein